MKTSLPRRIAPFTAATLALPLVAAAATSAAPAAFAAVAGTQTCAKTPRLLSTKPVSQLALPGGATARVWDTGHRAYDMSESRLAAVVIPRGKLTPKVVSAPTLTSGSTTAAMAAGNSRAVVALNGAVFDEYDLVPSDSQVLNGLFRKGTTAATRALAVYGTTKSAAIAKVAMTGTVKSVRGTIRVGAVNWQELSTAGVTVYTSAWGNWDHPTGRSTVVVQGGKVTGFLSGWDGEGRPGSGQTYLTARRGSTYAAGLAKLRVGDKVTVATAPAGRVVYGAKAGPLGAPTGVLGISSMLLAGGVNQALCSDRNETLRPRTAIGWKKNGDMVVAAVSGRAMRSGILYGGATVHQWADYMHQLGAVDAAIFDGGNSTTFLVRTKVGGPLMRLDRPGRAPQRSIADALIFQAG